MDEVIHDKLFNYYKYKLTQHAISKGYTVNDSLINKKSEDLAKQEIINYDPEKDKLTLINGMGVKGVYSI